MVVRYDAPPEIPEGRCSITPVNMMRIKIARAVLEAYIGGAWTDDEVLAELDKPAHERGDTLLTFLLAECCEEGIEPVEAQDRIFHAHGQLSRVYGALTPLL